MEETKNNTQNNSMQVIKLNELLTNKEIDVVYKLFKNNKPKEAKLYLNETERSLMLDKKGILADYLYYYLEYAFSTKQWAKPNNG